MFHRILNSSLVLIFLLNNFIFFCQNKPQKTLELIQIFWAIQFVNSFYFELQFSRNFFLFNFFSIKIWQQFFKGTKYIFKIILNLSTLVCSFFLISFSCFPKSFSMLVTHRNARKVLFFDFTHSFFTAYCDYFQQKKIMLRLCVCLWCYVGRKENWWICLRLCCEWF